jgi:rubrerythrin
MMEKTDDDLKTALAVIQRGMSIEQIGRAFYLRASQTTQDNTGQESFTNLANDEQIHYNLLKRQYESLVRESQWVSQPEIKPVAIDLNQRLFPMGTEEIEKAVNVKSSDWDALLFGMDIEIKSFDLYRKAALATVDIRGRQMFEWLAAQESSHFDTLMMRYDFLYGPVAWHP